LTKPEEFEETLRTNLGSAFAVVRAAAPAAIVGRNNAPSNASRAVTASVMAWISWLPAGVSQAARAEPTAVNASSTRLASHPGRRLVVATREITRALKPASSKYGSVLRSAPNTFSKSSVLVMFTLRCSSRPSVV